MKPKNEITGEQALELLTAGKQLEGYFIKGKLDLYKLKEPDDFEKGLINGFTKLLVIKDCIVEQLIATCLEFHQPVVFRDSIFLQAEMGWTYYIEGFEISDCVFEDILDFKNGGHNTKPISIKNSTFCDFVSFSDCWYQSNVTISGNKFKQGSDLLGNINQSLAVQFDVEPTIEHNEGKIDLDDSW